MRASPIQNSFNAGELSTLLEGRVDINKYSNGCSVLENFIPQIHGPVSKRPGTRFVREVKVSTDNVRLIPFEFNVEQAYVLEFGNQYMRVYMDGGVVESGGSPYEITTPYAHSEVADLQFAQSADVMYIAHFNHAPRKLSRTSHTNWTIESIAFHHPPVEWAAGNYPRTVAFFEERLWWAGTPNQPQTLWASKTGNYEDLTTGDHDGDALNYTIATDQVNAIRWLSPGKILVVGTSGGEFVVSASSAEEAVTPTNVRIVRQTTYGSSSVRALRIGSTVLFVQRSGKKIREFVYNFEADSYVAPDMTLLAEHILSHQCQGISLQQEPGQIIWCYDREGGLRGLTYERSEDVVGWHRHPLGGEGVVESIATIPHWDGDQDVTWLLVRRIINGVTKRYIEYIEKEAKEKDSFYVDCGLTYVGEATVISGLDHLEGESLDVLVDGAAHPRKTVTGGSITLDRTAQYKTHMGLHYESVVEGMRIEAGAGEGTAQGKISRITHIVFRLYETGSGFYYGPDGKDMNELSFRTSDDAMDAPVPAFSGDTDLLPWPGGYESGSRVRVKHALPLPCTVIAWMPQVVVNDR